MINLSRFDKF